MAEGSQDVCPKRRGRWWMPPLQSQGGWRDVTNLPALLWTHTHTHTVIFILSHTCLLSYWHFRWYQVLAGWLSYSKAADNCRRYWTRQSKPFITLIMWNCSNDLFCYHHIRLWNWTYKEQIFKICGSTCQFTGDLNCQIILLPLLLFPPPGALSRQKAASHLSLSPSPDVHPVRRWQV